MIVKCPYFTSVIDPPLGQKRSAPGKGKVLEVLGVIDLAPPEIDKDVETLIAQREKTRKSKD